MTHQTETAELIQAAAKLDPSAWLSAEGTPVRLHPDAAAALGGLLVAIANTDDETLNKASLVRSAALTAARVVAASNLAAACAHCGSSDHTWDDCEAYTRLVADAYARTLNTPPSAETCAAIRDRLHSGSEPAAVSAAVAPPTDQAALRDRITTAISRWHRDPEQPLYEQGADAVLAVLYREWPWLRAEAEDAAPTDQTALRQEIRRALAAVDGFNVRWLDEQDYVPQVEAVLAVLPPSTDRSAVLREAIDLAREEAHRLEEEVGIEAAGGARCVAYLLRKRLAKEQPLRRLADETPDTTADTFAGGSYLTAEHDTLGMIAARHGGDRLAWEMANPWVTSSAMVLPAGLRVAIPAQAGPAAGARQDGAPDDVVTELTEAEFHDAAGKALARLGLTYAELEDQARRRDFSSAQARSLWVTIGGAAPAGARQDGEQQ